MLSLIPIGLLIYLCYCLLEARKNDKARKLKKVRESKNDIEA